MGTYVFKLLALLIISLPPNNLTSPYVQSWTLTYWYLSVPNTPPPFSGTLVCPHHTQTFWGHPWPCLLPIWNGISTWPIQDSLPYKHPLILICFSPLFGNFLFISYHQVIKVCKLLTIQTEWIKIYSNSYTSKNKRCDFEIKWSYLLPEWCFITASVLL